MIITLIKAFILIILVLLAAIGAAALFLIICTIHDDMEMEARKKNNKQSE